MDESTVIFVILGALAVLTLMIERTFNYLTKIKVSDCCGSHTELSHSGSTQTIKPASQILGETMQGVISASQQLSDMKKNMV